MTAALAEACAALKDALPAAAALIPQPDTDGVAGHGKPGSRPPWNAQAAYAVYGATAAVRRLEAMLWFEVTGQPHRRRGGSDANTLAAIQAISDLGVNVSPATAAEAAIMVIRWVPPMRQLPAIDEDERFIRVHGAACPYCGNAMLRLGERSGRVTCIRFGACQDSDGAHPVGFVTHSVSGVAMIAWADGRNQYADVTAESAL